MARHDDTKYLLRWADHEVTDATTSDLVDLAKLALKQIKRANRAEAKLRRLASGECIGDGPPFAIDKTEPAHKELVARMEFAENSE